MARLWSDHWLESLLSVLPDEPERVETFCAEVTDWESLLRHAARHGLTGVLYNVCSAHAPGVPPPVIARLQRGAALQRLLNARLTGVLGVLIRSLERSGVLVAPLKGPLLGERLYGDAALRVASDLDLLVKPRQFTTASAVLTQLGFRAASNAGQVNTRRHQHHVAFHGPDGIVVELHYRLLSTFGADAPAEEFLDRSVSYRSSDGIEYRVLSPEDELLYLLVHAAGHCFERLAWLYDVKLLLRVAPKLDRALAAERARRLKLERVYEFACTTLLQRLKLPGLLERQGAIPPPHQWRWAHRLLRTYRHVPPRSSGSKIVGHLFRATLCERPATAARYLVGQGLRAVKQPWSR